MAITTKTNYYKYKFMKCDVLLPSEVISLSHADITNIAIEKDFDNDFLPIFNLKLLLDYEVYYKILENKTTVRFKIKLMKYIDDGNSDSSKIKFKEAMIDCIFGIYIEDDASATDKKLYEQTKKTLGDQVAKKEYDFYLFKDNDIKSLKYMSNDVITSSNMTDILVYLLSKSGVKKLLMSPLDNSKVYSEVLLPYTPLTQTINYLEQFYGFYKHGMLLFYDFDATYLISKRAKCTAYRINEYTNVTVTFFKQGSANSMTAGCFRDKISKKLILHISQDNMTPITQSIVTEQIEGTDNIVVSASTDSTNSVNPDVDTRGGKTTKVIVNNYENEYIPQMLNHRKQENSKIINCTLYDVDLTFLTPNKLYKLVFDDKTADKKYGGKYRLSYMMTTFNKGGEEFSSTTQVQFKLSE